MTHDPAAALARHVATMTYDALPATALTAAKRDILDTFGCMLGGSSAPGIDALFDTLGHWGGRTEARVLLHGHMLPGPQAAMLNASMGHALDFDDTLDTGGSIHPGVSVLAAALATADTLGGVDGRDFLLAVTLGLDVACRIALASTVDRGWHRTSCIGVFGAAMAASKLLRLTEAQTAHALGIAYSHAAGNRQCILDGALTKRLQAGQAASAGVLAAELARRDFTGAHNIFNGRYGFFELYQPNGADPSILTQELGRAFRGEELSFKPYPCGRPLHAAIDAALAVRAALGIETATDIASLTIEADPAGHQDQFASGAFKRHPTQVVEAQFAQPFLIATALAHGTVGIGHLSRFDDPTVYGLADRIQGLAIDDRPKGWVRVVVQHQDGRTMAAEATDPLGSPQRPLSDAQLQAKFRDCAFNARLPIADADVDAGIAMIYGLEKVPDTTLLTRLFV
jgi:2-methylcitrate dehydratase PrpD